MDIRKKNFAIAALRRASYRWPGRYNALKSAHVGRNQYVCAMCGPGIVHPKKNIQMDHIIPVVDPLSGYTNMDDYIERLLVDQDGWQVLCKPHHKYKTELENSSRTRTKKKSKKKAKNK